MPSTWQDVDRKASKMPESLAAFQRIMPIRAEPFQGDESERGSKGRGGHEVRRRDGLPLFLRGVGRLGFGAETRTRRSLPIERHCHGCGIEFGAAASPALVPLGVRVRYVDKYPHDVISADPELAGLEAVRPDVVCGAEKLEAIEDDSHDFVRAFSRLEQVRDPIGALASFTRVTRPGGTIIVSVPDKRFYGPTMVDR